PLCVPARLAFGKHSVNSRSPRTTSSTRARFCGRHAGRCPRSRGGTAVMTDGRHRSDGSPHGPAQEPPPFRIPGPYELVEPVLHGPQPEPPPPPPAHPPSRAIGRVPMRHAYDPDAEATQPWLVGSVPRPPVRHHVRALR